MRNFANIDHYLNLLKLDVYPEPESGNHDDITQNVFDRFITPNTNFFDTALDVGCGQGTALKRFRRLEINVIGITLDDKDYEQCLKQGFSVRLMDQSFLDFPDRSFDLVYARHVLEHSPFPLLTIFEFNRVLKNNGFMYVEVPWGESIHTNNPNHYSTLGKLSWVHLFKKAKFTILNDVTVDFKLENGQRDEYWGWWLTKSEDLPLELGDQERKIEKS